MSRRVYFCFPCSQKHQPAVYRGFSCEAGRLWRCVPRRARIKVRISYQRGQHNRSGGRPFRFGGRARESEAAPLPKQSASLCREQTLHGRWPQQKDRRTNGRPRRELAAKLAASATGRTRPQDKIASWLAFASWRPGQSGRPTQAGSRVGQAPLRRDLDRLNGRSGRRQAGQRGKTNPTRSP
jgi:hypothetical protein